MPQLPPESAAEAERIDVHVATRIKEMRIKLGLTHRQIAQHLKVTPEQIRKYERAANRITAGKLHLIAELFEVPIGAFYEGLSDAVH